MDHIRVVRVVVYEGPREWVEETIATSVQGTRSLGKGRYIHAETMGVVPEILQPPESTPDENKSTD